MQDSTSVLCKGSLVAQVKLGSLKNHNKSVVGVLNKSSSQSSMIRLKSVTKNTNLTEKLLPQKLMNKKSSYPKDEVTLDYFLFFYLDKQDHPDLRQYVKEVKASPFAYRQNFIVVHQVSKLKQKLNELKPNLCNRKLCLIVSQFGMLNYREEFKEIDEIHFFIPTQQKYSNVSFLMKEKNLKSIIYDFHNVDRLLQNLNVLKRSIQQYEFPSVTFLEKLKKIEVENQGTCGSTGFNLSTKHSFSKSSFRRSTSSNSLSSHEMELKAFKNNEVNFLKTKNSMDSEDSSVQFHKEPFLKFGFEKEKEFFTCDDQLAKKMRKSSANWLRNNKKGTLESKRDKDMLGTIYKDWTFDNTNFQGSPIEEFSKNSLCCY